MHDTYYVVAHFHYVMAIAAIFAMFGAYYYWIGKMSGRQYSERLAQIQFWVFFIGVNVLFFPKHFLGLAGHAAAQSRLSGRVLPAGTWSAPVARRSRWLAP